MISKSGTLSVRPLITIWRPCEGSLGCMPGGGTKFQILNLGWLRIRSGEALIEWLEERRAAGITGFHASLAGYGETHDRWNGRAGDFDYQTSILRLAGECGMARREKLFLAQNTLPIFDRLLDLLDGIPGEISSRTASPFFYAGLATRYESERLPQRFDNWLSERESIPIMLETADQPRKLLLKLDVDETNIDYLENTSCEEIFAKRERQYQESYLFIPALDELCSRYGDSTNRKIYMMSRDVEGRWMDLHEATTGTKTPID
jgi:hypothetical protein